MAGFEFRYTLDGGAQLTKSYVVADAEDLSIGEMVNLESGEADAGATGDTALIGACIEAVDNTADGENVVVTMNPNAVYGVVDENARLAGALLDLASGGMGVAASSNNEFVVIEDSAADEETLVAFNGTHYIKR